MAQPPVDRIPMTLADLLVIIIPVAGYFLLLFSMLALLILEVKYQIIDKSFRAMFKKKKKDTGRVVI